VRRAQDRGGAAHRPAEQADIGLPACDTTMSLWCAGILVVAEPGKARSSQQPGPRRHVSATLEMPRHVADVRLFSWLLSKARQF
jgi:hypothetical protein